VAERRIVLPIEYLAALNDQQKLMHEELLRRRDKLVAHSDHDEVVFMAPVTHGQDRDTGEWKLVSSDQFVLRPPPTFSQMRGVIELAALITAATDIDFQALNAAHVRALRPHQS